MCLNNDLMTKAYYQGMPCDWWDCWPRVLIGQWTLCCDWQSVIDLKNNRLMIGDTSTQFLHESELPEYARLNSLPGDVVPMDEDHQLAEALQRSANDASSPRHGMPVSPVLYFPCLHCVGLGTL